MTAINTGVFGAAIANLNPGAIQSFRVELDSATGTFYLLSPTTWPVSGETAAQYGSSMGFLLGILWAVPVAGANGNDGGGNWVQGAIPARAAWRLGSAAAVAPGALLKHRWSWKDGL